LQTKVEIASVDTERLF